MAIGAFQLKAKKRSDLSEINSVLTSSVGSDSLSDKMTEVARLSEGQGFGELAILNSGIKRQATIKCVTECHMATISKEDYLRIFKKLEDKAR